MLKIGDLATICGVTVKAIRFYETKNILVPREIDRWTGYRYYDETSVKRLSEILYLKNLGFSIKEIANFDENMIKQKTIELQNKIAELIKNINELSFIHKNVDGGFVMNNFVNDEKMIGKWTRIATVDDPKKYNEKNKYDQKVNNEIFPFSELYLLENGEQYWVVSWTKGIIKINGFENPYTVADNKMFVGIVDREDGSINDYAVYKQVDNKHYNKNEIKICDNINLSFVDDAQVIGFWNVVDFVRSPEIFNPEKKFWKDTLWLSKMIFEPSGELVISFSDGKIINDNKINIWTKNVVINRLSKTASEYNIITIKNETYLIMEWKSGDYTFGGKVKGYYVFKKQK